MRTILLALALGLPIALFFAWVFELTPEGIKKEEDVDRSRPTTHETGRKLDFIIIGLLAVALAYFVVDKTTQSPDAGTVGSIAVLPFTTQQPEHRDAAQSWIERALAIAPEDPRLQLLLGEYLYTGYLDYDAALAALDKAQRGMPGSARVYLNRGAVLRRRGDIDNAIEAFDKAQLFDPRDVFTAAHHVFTFLYTGDVAGARRQGDRVRALPTATSVHIGFTKYVDLFLLGDTTSMADFLRSRSDVDLGPEDQLKVFVPFLERRYDDALIALREFPDPIMEQHNLWTHSFVRARAARSRGTRRGA